MREVLIAGLVAAMLVAPASAETRDLRDFLTVEASGRFQVQVEVGDAFLVEVSGPDAAKLKTTVTRNGVLEIEPARRPWFGQPHYQAAVRVVLPRLEGVVAARGASVSAAGGGECEAFSAVSAMGSQLRASGINCPSISVAAAMGAQLDIQGACESLDIAAAMGATVNAGALQCARADVAAAMGADVSAYATASYEASAAMGGSVRMSGGGAASDTSTALGGQIRSLD